MSATIYTSTEGLPSSPAVDPVTMSPAEILREAADLLERNGWRQHALGSAGSAHCALGAIYEAAGVYDQYGAIRPSHRYSKAIMDARSALRATVRCTRIPDWNDNPYRTARDVIQGLRNAAREAGMPRKEPSRGIVR